MLEQKLDYLLVTLAQAKMMLEDARLFMERPFTTSDGPLWASDHVGLLVTLRLATNN